VTRRAALLALALAVPAPRPAAAGLATEPVVVTAAPSALPLGGTGRRVVVIGREEIERAPVRSVPELLAYLAGVDVRTRGPVGVQADVALRGATFEQTLVLVDGVRVSDPQTGHHLFDLPVTLAEIERIEVVDGAGSSLYGPNALGGVIHIVTRRAAARTAEAGAGAGEHGLLEATGSVAGPTGPVTHRLSLEARRSDGYRHNTDFETATASWGATAGTGPWQASLGAGWVRKDFGANGFYSERYPDQREATDATLLHGSLSWSDGSVTVTPGLSWRRHGDDYVLDDTVHGPARYENHHTTDVWGGRLEATVQGALGTTAVGLESGVESIASSRLGDHARTSLGLSAEHALPLGGGWRVRAGLSAWRYSVRPGWELSPGGELARSSPGGPTWYASAERAFRVPTYTELYYESPAQRGDPDLAPERAWTLETGLHGRAGAVRWNAAAFVRRGTDLIDWVRDSPEGPWTARNVAELTTRGLEAGVGWSAPSGGGAGGAWLRGARLDYAWLAAERGAVEGESRYVLDHLRHQAVLRVDHRLPLGVEQHWWLRYEEPVGGVGEAVLDATAERRWGPWSAAVEATNLLGAERERFPGVPLPGRWLIVRVARGFSWGGGAAPQE